jgi:hypothetical protein
MTTLGDFSFAKGGLLFTSSKSRDVSINPAQMASLDGG